MKATHAAGGDYIEFDVQLSKDKVPIVHHDFYTEDGRFVGDLTERELRELGEASGAEVEERPYVTLASFFDQLPDQLGFDIEIKYPRQYLDGRSQCPEFAWDPSDYAEAVVATVKAAASSRPMFYSCFVADICRLLRRLHPDCPVVYIGAATTALQMTEAGGYSPDSCLQLAVEAGLHGVAVNSKQLLLCPEAGRDFVRRCAASRMRCFTWGDANNSCDSRRLQSDWGVDGLIFDIIHAAGSLL